MRRRDDEPGRWAMTRSGHVAAIAAIAALAGLAAGATADGQQPTADRVVHGVKASGAGPLLSWTSVREATTYAVVVAGGDTTWSWLGPGTQVLFGTVETPNDVLHNPEDVPVQIVTATVGETYQILVTAFDSSGHAIASSGLTTFTYRPPAGSTLPSRPPRIYRRPVYDCEDLVPPAVRERHFPGAELEESSPCGVHLRAGCPWACTFRSGKGRERQRTSVNYDCQDTPRNLWDTTSKPPGARAVPSLGRAALLASEGTSRELLVYASQANCTISIRSNRDEQAVIDLARAVDAVLTPQVVGISR